MKAALIKSKGCGLVFAGALIVTILAGSGCTSRIAGHNFRASTNAQQIASDAILEISFEDSARYANKFFDVDVVAVFTSPNGVQHRVPGFYYGGDLWRVRFRPDLPGDWTYTYNFTGMDGFSETGGGTFVCLTGNAAGSIREYAGNRFRWVFDNGKPFFPLGLQDCMNVKGGTLGTTTIDGEGRGASGRRISWDEYFSIYAPAGFDLFRISQKNCSYLLFDDLDHYRVPESIATDELLSMAREHGVRVLFGFFGYHAQWTNQNRPLRALRRSINGLLGNSDEGVLTPDATSVIKKEERFVQYCIARWGVYADFWELLNERTAADKWTTYMANYVHTVDPDHKPVSTSWERPELPGIDINAPHWYESENELDSDLRVQQQAVKWKQAGKPVIVGEQGNTGMNWDPLSALRMRIRIWTALFEEISFVFWNTSWSKYGMYGGRYTPGAVANIYLGPEERGYSKVFRDFASNLDADVRVVPVTVNSFRSVRAYALISKHTGAVYLHHFENHTTIAEGVVVNCNFSDLAANKMEGKWIDPATGEVLSRVDGSSQSVFRVPPFKVDIALLLKANPAKQPQPQKAVRDANGAF